MSRPSRPTASDGSPTTAPIRLTLFTWTLRRSSPDIFGGAAPPTPRGRDARGGGPDTCGRFAGMPAPRGGRAPPTGGDPDPQPGAQNCTFPTASLILPTIASPRSLPPSVL